MPFDIDLPRPAHERENDNRNAQQPQPVLSPHEHDVLCGRGGLSNHHPGNSWYRRLVRSNRPLYRDSPKHTKLLVAKAIVHHVQSQDPPGRFLEIQRSTGLWVQVPYKKAVDKTSQGLREKEKDNEGGADTVPVNVPVILNVDEEGDGKSGAAAAAEGQKPRAKDMPTHIPNATSDISRPPALQQTSSWFWRNSKKQKMDESSFPSGPAPPAPPPPPEPLMQRASSLFRFFSNTKLLQEQQQKPLELPGAANSNTTFGDDDSLLMNPFGGSFMRNNEYQQVAMMNGAFDQSLEPTSVFGNSPILKSSVLEYPFECATGNIRSAATHNNNNNNNMNNNNALDVNAMDAMPNNRRKRTRDSFEDPSASLGDGIDAPSLTRLTTQVSDWLQSFWPLGDERNRQKTMSTNNAQPDLPAANDNTSIQYRQMEFQQQQHQQQLQDRFNQQPQRPLQPIDAQEIQQQLLVMAKNLANLQRQIQSSTQDDETAITANQIQMQMEQLQQMSDSISQTSAPLAPPQPPPTLQPNVSSTLFHLASSPSRLFAGLSAFFTDPKSSDVSHPGDNNGRIMMNPMTAGIGTGNDRREVGINDGHFSSQPVMESNNSASLMPPPLGMASLNFNVSGDPFASDSGTGTNDQIPTFGRRSSNRSLLDDDDDD